VGGDNGHHRVEAPVAAAPAGDLQSLLHACASTHHHLCPRQVLGVRMGLLAGRWLGLHLPRRDKRLLAIVETDGCLIDGIAVATGCRVGRRTLRVLDYGKMAATFVDIPSERALRVTPHPNCREAAACYAAEATGRWEAYLVGYQRMPDEILLVAEAVTLTTPLAQLLSREGVRVRCEVCGEEVFNEREVWQAGQRVCRTCAGETYYRAAHSPIPPPTGGSD
jgi:formylmethanofuran dehydrogenase subunit E